MIVLKSLFWDLLKMAYVTIVILILIISGVIDDRLLVPVLF